MAGICIRLSKQFQADDIRRRWLFDRGDLLKQEAMFRALAEAGLSLERPTRFDSAETLRVKALDHRERARKVDDEPLRGWLFETAAKAEQRAMSLDAGLSQVDKVDPTRLTNYERENFEELAPFKVSISAEMDQMQGRPHDEDGPLKPDGFRLNGNDVWGLAEDRQKTLTFVWEHRNDPPKWQDVATHLGVLEHTTDDGFRGLIYKINQKTKDHWPETLQTVRGLVVLRIPIRGQKAAHRSKAKIRTAKKSSPKMTRQSVSKKVSVKKSSRNKRATKK